MGKTIWTIGHSTRTFDEFFNLLSNQDISLLVDVRRFPGSRKWPHFAQENLQKLLEERRIEYLHMEALGGRRKVNRESKNVAWRNSSFRAYADYSESSAFHQALSDLMEYATNKNVAYMCSEAVWWRCHRSIISDYLTVKGWEVLHILSESRLQKHPYTAAANVENGKLNYKGVLGG